MGSVVAQTLNESPSATSSYDSMKYTSFLKIFVFSIVIFLFTPTVSFAATLQVLPVTVSVNAGEAFTQTIFVASTDQALNAISGTVTFPTNLLSVASLSKNNSVLTLWVQQPKFSNGLGTVKWSGVLPNPGFTGNRGKVFSIRFVAKRSGTATIGFSSSEVLANNGAGTDILKATNPARIYISNRRIQSTLPSVSQRATQILHTQITSSTHPNQTKWYSRSHVILDWTNTSKATAVRLGYDQNANGTPTVFYSNPISHKELQLSDGIWYFHIQEKKSNSWGPISTFRIQIDTVSPLPIQLQFPNGTTTATTTIAVQFSTTDALSGIDHYTLLIDGNTTWVDTQNGSTVYALPVGNAGTHTLSVTAYDKAGNSVRAEGKFISTMERVSSSPTAPVLIVWLVTNYLSLLLLVIAMFFIVLFISWYLWHHFHAFRRKKRSQLDPAHRLLREQFTRINGEIVKEVLSLEKVRTKRELTREEEQIIMNLRKVLEEAETTLSKEISTIEQQKKESDIS